MDGTPPGLSQGDQILDQLRQYDQNKLQMLRSRSSESQLNTGRRSSVSSGTNANTSTSAGTSNGLSNFKNRTVSSSRLSELLRKQRVQPGSTKTAAIPKITRQPAFTRSKTDLTGSLDLRQKITEMQLRTLEEPAALPSTRPHQYTSLNIQNAKPLYVPPINFAVVEGELYRSGHPQPVNFEFLRTLKLKTIIYVGDKEDNYEYYRWIQDNGISFRFYKLKEVAGADHADEVMNSLLNILLNRDNYPILMHSNKGKHRVGVVVGLIRAYLQGWTLSGAFDEYGKFSHEKGDYDLEFIEMFQPRLKVDPLKKPRFVRIETKHA